MSEFSPFSAEMREKVNCSSGAREAALGRMELAVTRSRIKELASEPTIRQVTSARGADSLRGFSTQSVLAPIVRKMDAVGAFAAANADVAGASAVPYYDLEDL